MILYRDWKIVCTAQLRLSVNHKWVNICSLHLLLLCIFVEDHKLYIAGKDDFF